MKAPFVTADPLAVVQAAAQPFVTAEDEARVLAWIGDARIVLLGESSHGTQDFYVARANLSRRLIAEKGFSAIAIEGDWPDALAVNRYIQGAAGVGAHAALAGFQRFPTWMWRNTVIAELIEWLRGHNQRVTRTERKVGFYGLDLYSLRASMEAVVAYLNERDPHAARAARASYACFDQFGAAADDYAWAAHRLGTGTCEDAVTEQLVALHRRQAELLRRDGAAAADEFFHAEQNARVARNAERYYRTMLQGRVTSWNIRDEHMAETLDHLLQHLERHGREPKVIVWAHNSHLGDARATEMGDAGELNLGQLAREQYGADTRSIGFTTHTGTVIAASDWGAPAERKRVRPALAGSFEELLHETGRARLFLPIPPDSAVHEALAQPRLERAIGVIYRPESERLSHYFHARLADQFDAVIHLDETLALQPLDRVQPPLDGEPPETFPEGT
jgi:erythromycin esterase-like protein